MKYTYRRNGLPLSREYIENIDSDRWCLGVRPAVHATARGLCERCPDNPRHGVDVHHLTYRNLGHEPLTDVMLVCRECHRNLHHERDSLRKMRAHLGDVYDGSWVYSNRTIPPSMVFAYIAHVLIDTDGADLPLRFDPDALGWQPEQIDRLLAMFLDADERFDAAWGAACTEFGEPPIAIVLPVDRAGRVDMQARAAWSWPGDEGAA